MSNTEKAFFRVPTEVDFEGNHHRRHFGLLTCPDGSQIGERCDLEPMRPRTGKHPKQQEQES